MTNDDHLTQRDHTDVIIVSQAVGPNFLEPHIASCGLTRQGDTQVRVGVTGIGRTVCVRHVVIGYRQLEVGETIITYNLNPSHKIRRL